MKAAKTLEGKVTDDVANRDMNMAEFTTLETLYNKGPQTVRQISNGVLIKFGSITYVIDKLVKKEYVERINSTEDRRVVYIHITKKGKKVMDAVFPQHKKAIERMFQDVSDYDKEMIIEVLNIIGNGKQECLGDYGMQRFEPHECSERENYKVLTGSIIPRPIAFITIESKAGALNAAPFSYFNIVTADPPMLSIAIQRQAGKQKDTAHNIL